MIRIYLDWNVVSNLKRPKYKKLKEFIHEHKDCFQFPYSSAHFNDLMKSYSPENKFFNQDLEMLEYLSEKHLIIWENKRTFPKFETPKQYFEGEKENTEDIFSLMDMEKLFGELDEISEDVGMGKMGGLIKSLFKLLPAGIEVNDESREILQKMFPNIRSNSSMWDLMKDISPFARNLLQDKEYYKDFRKSLGDKGFKVEPNAGNWSEEEVIDNIDKFLKNLGTEITFMEYIESTFKHRKEPTNRYEFFTTAYLMLDMIGYKADKLPKPTDNMQNIQTDGEHSFYAAHCDYFVVGDKKLRIKSKVLYNNFNIPTVVLSPDEVIDTLKRVIYKFPENVDFVDEAFSFIDSTKVVESYPLSEHNEAETYAIKLPKFYFNFFNYIVYRYYPSKNGIVLTFKKVFKNYSDFIYYTESERLIDKLVSSFGYDDMDKLEEIKQEFVYGDKAPEIIWTYNGVAIKLGKDEDTKRPILSYFIMLKEEEKKEENSD